MSTSRPTINKRIRWKYEAEKLEIKPEPCNEWRHHLLGLLDLPVFTVTSCHVTATTPANRQKMI